MTPAFTPVDAHAHYYPAFGRQAFLDAAARNMAAVDGPREVCGLLLLAEPRPDGDPLAAWRTSGADAPGWVIRATVESTAVVARREDGTALILIAGRQLTTTEGLEVLGLAMDAETLIRRPLRQTIDQIRLTGGVPVVPWSFGKWWGRRGRILLDLLAAAPAPPLFMGESGCRPTAARDHRAFRLARESSIPVLPGSDPLPIPSHGRRAGSVGFLFPGAIDPEHPTKHVRAYLSQLHESPQTYGRRESALAFMVSQISLRVARRRAMLMFG